MKQRYSIVRDEPAQSLIIREFGELDKDILSLLCEESFPEQRVREAMLKGKAALMATLRTNNMFPPFSYAEKIADTVIGLYREGAESSVDVDFDDREFLTPFTEGEVFKEEKEDEELEVEDEEADELEDLLEDDDIDIQSPSLKIADDDMGDSEDEP